MLPMAKALGGGGDDGYRQRDLGTEYLVLMETRKRIFKAADTLDDGAPND
jgi:hypothetical protein